ncbi:MAG: PstS family phosphate ABC transporter substrate-binding protein [Actinomycetota bacterium]|nr:PstS family phosphate ABC transporter substrate-binding protein [Actinomycetota bacterium]
MRKNRALSLIGATIAFLIAASFTFAGCGAGAESTGSAGDSESQNSGLPYEGEELVLSGSTTFLQVSAAWAEAFMEEYGGTVIVNAGGSGGGIADLINGINNLANASRQIKDEEMDAAANAGYDVQEYTVLYDGIAVIVSGNVSVDNLTMGQLSKIYTGEVTNWKDVGGDDVGIVVVARDSSSGTGEYFLEEIVQMGKPLRKMTIRRMPCVFNQMPMLRTRLRIMMMS